MFWDSDDEESCLGLFDDSLVGFSSIGKQPKSYDSFDELNGSDESMSFSVLQGDVANNRWMFTVDKLDVTEESEEPEVTEEPEEKNDFICLLPYFGVPFFSLHAVMWRFLLNSLNLLMILVQ